jgi:hypothetical protein
VILTDKFVGPVKPQRAKFSEFGPKPLGMDFGLSVRVASLFTVALVLQ